MNGNQVLELRKFIEKFLYENNFLGVHVILENTTQNKKIFSSHFGEYINHPNKKKFSEKNIEKFLVTTKVFSEVSFKKPRINLLGAFYYKNENEPDEYLCSVTGRKDQENFEISLAILGFVSKKTKEQIFENTPNWVLEHFVPK